MKKSNVVLIFFLALLLPSFWGNAQNEMSKNHQWEKIPISTSEKTKSQTIALKKGGIFLMISSETKSEREKQMNQYFKEVFPVAQKNGFKPLAAKNGYSIPLAAD